MEVYKMKVERTQQCVLYERECIGCMECETCDLDPNKVCDNCGKCIEMDDVASIKIDKIYMNPEEYKE
jgi:ferredoxin